MTNEVPVRWTSQWWPNYEGDMIFFLSGIRTHIRSSSLNRRINAVRMRRIYINAYTCKYNIVSKEYKQELNGSNHARLRRSSSWAKFRLYIYTYEYIYRYIYLYVIYATNHI